MQDHAHSVFFQSSVFFPATGLVVTSPHKLGRETYRALRQASIFKPFENFFDEFWVLDIAEI